MVSAPRADDQCDYCFVDCCYKYCDLGQSYGKEVASIVD